MGVHRPTSLAQFTSLGQHSEKGVLSTSAGRFYHRQMLSRDPLVGLKASWYLVVFSLAEITAS